MNMLQSKKKNYINSKLSYIIYKYENVDYWKKVISFNIFLDVNHLTDSILVAQLKSQALGNKCWTPNGVRISEFGSVHWSIVISLKTIFWCS